METMPLGEEPAAVGMLLLGDAQEDQLAFLDVASHFFVPDRHLFAAAHSPGGEMNEQHFLPEEVRKRNLSAGPDVWQSEVRMALADLGCVRFGQGRAGRG